MISIKLRLKKYPKMFGFPVGRIDFCSSISISMTAGIAYCTVYSFVSWAGFVAVAAGFEFKGLNRYIARWLLAMWWIQLVTASSILWRMLASIEVKFLLTAVFNGAPTAISQRWFTCPWGGLFLLKYLSSGSLSRLTQLLEMFAAKREPISRTSFVLSVTFYRMYRYGGTKSVYKYFIYNCYGLNSNIRLKLVAYKWQAVIRPLLLNINLNRVTQPNWL
jgi:hypothetical protein